MNKPDKYSKLTSNEMLEVETVWIKNPTTRTVTLFWEENKTTLFKHIHDRILGRIK